jgi:site-specific DNA recombinase
MATWRCFEEMKMTAIPWIIYTRVSTEEQTHGASLDAQRESCEAYLKAHGFTWKHIQDAGISAKDLKRPGIQKVMGLVAEKKIAGILVWKLDRLTRRLRDMLDIVDLCKEHSVSLASIQERIDTSGPMGQFQLSIMGAFAQLEREQIAERVRLSCRHRMAQGLFTGGLVPAGMQSFIGEDGKRRIRRDPETAPIIESLWQKALAGESIGALTRYLQTTPLVPQRGGKWGTSGVSQLLKKQRYIGHLVSQEDFDKVQIIVSTRSGLNAPKGKAMPDYPRPSERIWPLRGIAVCHECGAAIIGSTSTGRGGKKFSYLRCSGRMRKNGCTAQDMPADQYERLVIEQVAKAIDSDVVRAEVKRVLDKMAVELPQYREEMNALVTQKNHASQKLKRFIDFVAGEDIAPADRKGIAAQITSAQRSLDDIEHQIAKKEGEIAAKEVTAGHITVVNIVIDKVSRTLKNADSQTASEILPDICEKIRISRKNLHLSLYVPATKTPDSEESGVVCTEECRWWAILRGVQTVGIDFDLVKMLSVS